MALSKPTSEIMSSSNDHYNSLLRKIKELGQSQDEAYGEQIRCEAGCYHCCHPPDSLFQVEAETLEAAISALSTEQKERIAERLVAYEQDNSLLCPLLENGCCQVYESRPSICRTQGYALSFPQEQHVLQPSETPQTSTLSWCQLNFTEQQPNKELAFDVERLNTMLSLITSLGWPEQPPRRDLVPLIRSGISSKSLISKGSCNHF